ncbi:MAG TPA: ATP-grasp domain-containing protein, partial [Spongiibacteraceae bacterium]|nr:ATP-grasp domain-containing protein [Spongiibacteraceae bacterium]
SRYFADATALNVAEITNYPVVVKPCLSRIKLTSGWLNSTVHIAANAHELQTLINDKAYLRHPFMLQEFIPGHGAGIFALYDRGQSIAFFAHQRLREKPPSGGVSTLSSSVTPDARMLNMAKKLLDAAQWHGVAMIEFRIAPDRKPYLMEVNTRFWGSLQLAIDAGVDFPALLLQISRGEPLPPTASYRIGQCLRWLLGDIDSLYLTLRAADLSLGHKLKRLCEFATPHPFATRHEINRWNDLGPAWFELKAYLKDLLG